MAGVIHTIDNIGSKFESAFMRLLVWRERHIKEKTFVIILALVVGVLGGFRGTCAEMAYPCHIRIPHGPHVNIVGQLHVSVVSVGRYIDHESVCEVCGEG